MKRWVTFTALQWLWKKDDFSSSAEVQQTEIRSVLVFSTRSLIKHKVNVLLSDICPLVNGAQVYGSGGKQNADLASMAKLRQHLSQFRDVHNGFKNQGSLRWGQLWRCSWDTVGLGEMGHKAQGHHVGWGWSLTGWAVPGWMAPGQFCCDGPTSWIHYHRQWIYEGYGIWIFTCRHHNHPS